MAATDKQFGSRALAAVCLGLLLLATAGLSPALADPDKLRLLDYADEPDPFSPANVDGRKDTNTLTAVFALRQTDGLGASEKRSPKGDQKRFLVRWTWRISGPGGPVVALQQDSPVEPPFEIVLLPGDDRGGLEEFIEVTVDQVWNGSDAAGQPVASGVYSYLVEAASVRVDVLGNGGTKEKVIDQITPVTGEVRVDNVPPTITATATPPPNGNGWNNTDVTVSFDCSDDVGVVSCPEPVVVTGDCVQQEVTGTVMDVAGNTASTSLTVRIDKLPPAVAGVADPPANANGWNNTAVTVSFEASDSCSAIAEVTAPVTLGGEGADQSVSGSATDLAGNTASTEVVVSIDLTPPVIVAAPEPPPNAAGWNNAPVTVGFDCQDALSGIETCSAPVTVATEGAGQAVAGEALDLAGNSAATTVSVSIDLTPPTIVAAQSPPPNAAGWNNTPVTVSFDCQDALSGVATCSEPVELSGEGANQSLTGSAADLAGNSATAGASVSIDLTPPSFDPAEFRPLPCPELTLELRAQVRACFADALSGVSLPAVQLTVDGVDRTAAATLGAGCISWDPPDPFAPGEHQAGIAATDQAGNSGSAGWCFGVASPAIEIAIDSPAPGLLTRAAVIEVSGTVEDLADTVFVNGVAAVISGGTFVALDVPLREGKNVLTAVARNAAGGIGTASVTVSRDTSPPTVRIETPRDGAVLTSLQVDVAGLINDIVTGTTINPDDCQVWINGVEAEVANRAFIATDLLLKRGPNTLLAEARDRAGNVATQAIQVTVQDQAGQRILLLAGNNQRGEIFTELPRPMIVVLEDANGDPVPGRPVTFEVVRGEGTVSAFPQQGSAVTVVTDEIGQASASFRLSGRSGAGNNRVRATAPGFLGEVEFCASAASGPAARITPVSGNGQRGVVERDLPLPLVVLVTDAGGNPVAGVEATFEAAGGGGFGGSTSVVVATDLDGLAEVAWTLGPDEGINNNIALVTFPGQAEPAAVFQASARRLGRPADTRIVGLVLDNQDNPVPGATVTVEGTALSTVSDAEGRFEISGVPVGSLLLLVDGSTTPRPGDWPAVEFELTTIAGRDNSLDRPAYLLPLAQGQLAGGPADVTLMMDNIPGAELTVLANSVTCPDGATECEVRFTQVRSERVPMEPPLGSSFMLAWTIQPAGTHFDPPARVCIPNADMAPGQQIEMFSFDHDQGAFVAIGTATVTDDGSQLCSDPGFGIVKSGWGGCVPPPPPKDCVADCGPCKECNRDTGSCEPVADGTSCDDMKDCTFDDKCMGGSCKGEDVEITKVTGDCVAAVGAATNCTAEANRPDLVEWMAPGGSPDSGMGASFSTTYSSEGSMVVTAKCDASSKTKKVDVAKSCAGITPTLLEPEVAGSAGGNFGAVAPGSRQAAKYEGCVDSGKWCFRLEEYLEEHTFAVNSQGRTDISGATDPDVTPATCAAIISDLTPPPAGTAHGPPRRTYWSQAATTAHEREHVANVSSMITQNVFSDLQTFVSDAGNCTDCKSAVPTGTFDAEMRRLFTSYFRAMAPTEEVRAHNVSNPMYSTLISDIRARANAAPPAEGWPAACQ